MPTLWVNILRPFFMMHKIVSGNKSWAKSDGIEQVKEEKMVIEIIFQCKNNMKKNEGSRQKKTLQYQIRKYCFVNTSHILLIPT